MIYFRIIEYIIIYVKVVKSFFQVVVNIVICSNDFIMIGLFESIILRIMHVKAERSLFVPFTNSVYDF